MFLAVINFIIDFFSADFWPKTSGQIGSVLVYFGDWICILACCLIAVLSRICFKKTFIRPVWKVAFCFIIGTYLMIFLVNSISLTAEFFVHKGGNFFIEMDEMMEYTFSLLIPAFLLLIFTVIYAVAFLIRLIKHLIKRKKNGKGDASCSTF